MAKWPKIKLGDVCDIERGGSPRPIDKFITENENGVNWIKIGDTTESMYITKTAQKIIPEGVNKSRFVEAGDFLLSNSMSFGRPYILKIDGCIHDGWLVLRDKNACFDKHFLYYNLSSPVTYEKFKSMAVGGVVNNLNTEMVKNLYIAFPPLEEQRRIASILDKVTDLITKRRTQLEKLDLLVKSRFVEMFGTERDFSKWNIAKVEDVAEVCVGVVIKPSQYYAEVGIKAFRSLNIGVMNVKNSDWVYFSEEGHLKNAKSTVHEGDILVVRSGAPGTACVVTKEYDGCNAVDIIIARPNSKKINSVFLAAFTNYPHGMNQIQKGTGGAAQQHFNVGQYKTMQIILPPLDLQNEFALYFHQTETTKSNIQKSLETLETLKKALMQEYFG